MSRRPAAAGASPSLEKSEQVVALPRLPLERAPSPDRVVKAVAFALAMAVLALCWELLPQLLARFTKHVPHWSLSSALLLAAVFAVAGFVVSYIGFASSAPPASRHDSA